MGRNKTNNKHSILMNEIKKKKYNEHLISIQFFLSIK